MLIVQNQEFTTLSEQNRNSEKKHSRFIDVRGMKYFSAPYKTMA
jgi:hypothetical protein